MNPVRGYEMINFLHWVQGNHPEIASLRDLPKDELMSLVNQYEGGRMRGGSDRERQWLSSFNELFRGSSGWEGYASARRELRHLEHKRRCWLIKLLDIIGNKNQQD
jgi:hypothetical protein